MKKLVILTMLMFSSTAFAITIAEQTTPNEIRADAQVIENNRTDATDYYEGSNLLQRVVEGNIDYSDDIDWYKVDLVSYYQNVIFINSNINLKIEVKDENGNSVIKSDNTQVVNKIINYVNNYNYMGAKPFELSINKPGTYFVKISSTGQTGAYKFGIGKPDYMVGSYENSSLHKIVLSENNDSGSSDLYLDTKAGLKDLEDAVVVMASLTGRTEGKVRFLNKAIKYSRYGAIRFPSYYSMVNISPGQNVKINSTYPLSEWAVEISGQVEKSYGNYGKDEFTFYPSVRLTFVFPLTEKNFNKIKDFQYNVQYNN